MRTWRSLEIVCWFLFAGSSLCKQLFAHFWSKHNWYEINCTKKLMLYNEINAMKWMMLEWKTWQTSVKSVLRYCSSESVDSSHSLVSSLLSLLLLVSSEKSRRMSNCGKGGRVWCTGRLFPFTLSQPWPTGKDVVTVRNGAGYTWCSSSFACGDSRSRRQVGVESYSSFSVCATQKFWRACR